VHPVDRPTLVEQVLVCGARSDLLAA